MQQIIIYLFLAFAAIFVSYRKEKCINISFELLDSISVDNSRILQVHTNNPTNKNFYILAGYLINKIDIDHPCREKMLGEYSRIGSHKNFDCQINRGDLLFTYLKTEPFDIRNLSKLKESIQSEMGEGKLENWFYYLRPGFRESHAIPYFVFIKAHQSTNIYFKVSANLNPVDKGDYQLSWFSQREIDSIIESKKVSSISFKDLTKKLSVNGYEYYNGKLIINRAIIRL